MLTELTEEQKKFIPIIRDKWINRALYDDTFNLDNKKLVELFGDYYHKGENPHDKIDYYKNIGYDCIVVWASEIERNLGDVLVRIQGLIDLDNGGKI